MVDFKSLPMSRKKKAKGQRRKAEGPLGTGRSEAPLKRRKLWVFRLVAAVVVPIVCLLVIEFGLRLSGFGYPTSFLISRPTSSFQQPNTPTSQWSKIWVQ